MKLTRVLYIEDDSGAGHLWVVDGTQAEVEASGARMLKLHGGAGGAGNGHRCVFVLSPVGHVHRKGCEEHPDGGFWPYEAKRAQRNRGGRK